MNAATGALDHTRISYRCIAFKLYVECISWLALSAGVLSQVVTVCNRPLTWRSLRSRRKHKAWGVSPRDRVKKSAF